jgi:hypothetical protein
MGQFSPILVSFEVAQGVVWPEEWWNTLDATDTSQLDGVTGGKINAEGT